MGLIHIRTDNAKLNINAKFACGIGWPLPKGDVYFFKSESGASRATCPICNPNGPRQLGTPISELSGRVGQPGYSRFCEIASSWDYVPESYGLPEDDEDDNEEDCLDELNPESCP